MSERYGSPGDSFSTGDGPDDDCPYAWISEWLCEYVDGAMDPSMRAVFEEYLDANPKLAAHVERLCHTRALLNECECRRQAAERAKARLRRSTAAQADASPDEKATEDTQAEVAEIEARIQALLAADVGDDADAPAASRDASPSAGTVAAVASAMTLMLGVGFFAGAYLFADPAAPSTVAAPPTVQPAPDRPARAHASPSRPAAVGARAQATTHAPAGAPPLRLPSQQRSRLPADTFGVASPPLVQQIDLLDLPRP